MVEVVEAPAPGQPAVLAVFLDLGAGSWALGSRKKKKPDQADP